MFLCVGLYQMDIQVQLRSQAICPLFSHVGFEGPITLILPLLNCVDLNICKSYKMCEERLSNQLPTLSFCPKALFFDIII